ncbi:MAG: hypothetical protein EBX70_10920 [Betaproteobacteria bacterium]|nr:hypothetical protein [Betaproteobacteria bacterium]
MEGGRGIGLDDDLPRDGGRVPAERQRQDAVVGAQELLAGDAGPDEPTPGADARIDDDDVQRPCGMM